MNATQKAEILKQAGYFYTTSSFASTKHRWYQGEGNALSASPWLSAGETFAMATNAAYGLYLQAQKESRLGQQIYMTEAEIVAESQTIVPAPVAEPAHCSNCGKALSEGCLKSEYVDGQFCSTFCLDEYEHERSVGMFSEPTAAPIASPAQPLSELHARIAKLEAELKLEKQRSEEALAFVHQKLSNSEGDWLGQRTLAEVDSDYMTGLEAANGRYKEVIESVFPALREFGMSSTLAILQSALQAPAPVAEAVTLTEDEIEWLARSSTEHEYFVNAVGAHSMTGHLQGHVLKPMGNPDIFGRWLLTDSYDTPANRAAIETKRQSLKAQS